MARIKNKTRGAYYDVKSTEDKIFALYSGQVIQNGEYHYNTILTFDWNGKPLRIYKLDIPLVSFDIDAKNNRIYGLNVENKPIIVEYTL